MMKPTCTRRLEFDAAHRVTRHESKCRNLHGHRYAVEITVEADGLDECGRVVDFGEVKSIVGTWIDERWDHGTLLHPDDVDLHALCDASGWRHYTMSSEPTAENIAAELGRVAGELLAGRGLRIVRVRVYETPNCWADWLGPEST
jgi:6-pyruvoyltetrahydropterin/6-carboxytetrahydropterin synthase